MAYERKDSDPDFAADWLAAQAAAEASLRMAFLGKVRREIDAGDPPFRFRVR